MSRMKTLELLKTYVNNDQLLKHCVAVEVAMKAYAGYYGEDVEYWGSVGLLHDIDFEKFPDDHPNHAREILSAHGYDDRFILDVESHARDWTLERTTLQKTLLAVDELTGFIIACALVRPDKSLDNLEVKSVMKKMKDKAFARAVNRQTILDSAESMGVDFKEHVGFITKALAEANRDPLFQDVPLIG